MTSNKITKEKYVYCRNCKIVISQQCSYNYHSKHNIDQDYEDDILVEDIKPVRINSIQEIKQNKVSAPMTKIQNECAKNEDDCNKSVVSNGNKIENSFRKLITDYKASNSFTTTSKCAIKNDDILNNLLKKKRFAEETILDITSDNENDIHLNNK